MQRHQFVSFTQLSLLCRARGTAEAGLAVGLRRAVASRVGPRRHSRISLQVRLAHPQSDRDPRWGVLSHALCLPTGHPYPFKSSGILNPVSSATTTSRWRAGTSAAVVTL